MVPICQAIQHAHQKGIIHRDIKPSNVLVTLYDGVPVPKVIDFGVAKAVDRRPDARTCFTQDGMIVGTLEYMSPEQAESGVVDVDTRTDIYSLGVLLYELLTGSTPLGRRELRFAGYSEILRRIREEEPPSPSIRLSTGQEIDSIAARCRTEPAKLARMVRGEVDWIAMKSLEKDRSRRYPTANDLARDLQRYLTGEPIEAGPPSITYRLGKFARRHRVPGHDRGGDRRRADRGGGHQRRSSRTRLARRPSGPGWPRSSPRRCSCSSGTGSWPPLDRWVERGAWVVR